MASLSQPAEPIARSAAGTPLAFAALGFAFHLEPLAPADGEGLAKACDRIAAACGTSLRWTWSSVHGEVERFDHAALDLIASYPAQLVVPPDVASLADARARAGAMAMTAAHFDKFGVACHGGPERNVASPFTLRFFASTTADGDALRADAMLMVTLPLATPTAELAALATGVAGDLRIRWGAAGFTYGAWELDRYGETRDAVYAHARRYPGFDVGQHATWMRAFHDRVRTVSWLTFLGKDLTGALRAAGDSLASDDLVAIEPCGEGVMIRAGARPEPGDTNRRRLPAAYARVDRRVRAVRAAEGLHFYAPWSNATTEQWLRRFEDA
ncbi:MAG: hypothetical protein JWO86_3796 [Myxococcaceae bacterium]|nr:hypothetical protein [Myxococcaceae bacterium]